VSHFFCIGLAMRVAKEKTEQPNTMMTKQMKERSKKRSRVQESHFATNKPLVAALKYPEACKYLGGIHVATLRRMVDRGLIRPNKMLRCVLFPISELDRALQEGLIE